MIIFTLSSLRPPILANPALFYRYLQDQCAIVTISRLVVLDTRCFFKPCITTKKLELT